MVFFNNFSNMEKNSWENHHAKWWDFPAMFDDIYSFWIISCGEFPMSFFFGSAKKAGLLEAKKWVNIVTREDIDHLIFVLQYLFVSTVSWVLGATLKKVSVSLDPQNDGTFTKKIWHNQSTKNFGLDIFPYFSIFFLSPKMAPQTIQYSTRVSRDILCISIYTCCVRFFGQIWGCAKVPIPKWTANTCLYTVYIQYIYICIYIYICNITYIYIIYTCIR